MTRYVSAREPQYRRIGRMCGPHPSEASDPIDRSPQPYWRNRGYDDDGKTADTIHVPEREDYEDTGLLDADGNRLYRARDPIGFKVRG